MTSQQTGELHITGIIYSINTSSLNTSISHHNITSDGSVAEKQGSPIVSCTVRGHQTLDVTGPRLNSTKQEMTSQMYGPDRRLDLVVTNAMPRLQVKIVLK